MGPFWSRAGLFLTGKDVNEFVDKVVTEALKKEEEVMCMTKYK
ncbi:MAG: hypothetical protein OEZ07_01085 [Dehalococcoidia bacterium]|nr:hypothetical protein [Dehalococcoidia bacterium]